MNRIGIPHNIAADFIKKVQNTDYIDLRGVFTHFADVESDKVLAFQKENFKR